MLITETRTWKNVSHVGWCNGLFIIVLSLINLGVFSMNIIMIGDVCRILKSSQETKTMESLTDLIPASTGGFLANCMFGDGNVANFLGVQ